MTNTPN